MMDYEEIERYWIQSYRENELFCLTINDRNKGNQIIDSIKIPIKKDQYIYNRDLYKLVEEFQRKCHIFNLENIDFHLYDEILHEYLEIPYRNFYE